MLYLWLTEQATRLASEGSDDAVEIMNLITFPVIDVMRVVG